MKNVLVIGSTGQIGSELTMKIRNMYPEGNVVAGYIKGAEPKGVLLESGPAEEADVCNGEQLLGIVKKYNIDTIYNLAALLSAVAERKPQLAWHIQIDGLMNILEIARENNVAVFTPSSIGSFGPETPHIFLIFIVSSEPIWPVEPITSTFFIADGLFYAYLAFANLHYFPISVLINAKI